NIPNVNAYIPQAGSGTRNFWLTYLFGTATPTLGPCVHDTKNGVPIEEHDGRGLNGDPNGIAPISIAQNIAQAGGALPDIRGDSTLGEVDANQADPTNDPNNDVAPTVINSGAAAIATTGWPIQREVYNVIPTSKVTDPLYTNVFANPPTPPGGPTP